VAKEDGIGEVPGEIVCKGPVVRNRAQRKTEGRPGSST